MMRDGTNWLRLTKGTVAAAAGSLADRLHTVVGLRHTVADLRHTVADAAAVRTVDLERRLQVS